MAAADHRAQLAVKTWLIDTGPLVAYIDRNETVVYANLASGALMGMDAKSFRGRREVKCSAR